MLVLVALVVGLPAALHALGGFPVPRRVPSSHQIGVTLVRPDDGALFLGAVRWVSWLAWATFTVSTVAELVAQVRRRPVPRMPVIGPAQALASTLVGTVAMGLLPAIYQSASAAPLHMSARWPQFSRNCVILLQRSGQLRWIEVLASRPESGTGYTQCGRATACGRLLFVGSATGSAGPRSSRSTAAERSPTDTV